VTAVLAFLAGFLTDAFWAVWHRYNNDDREIAAANASIGIYVCGVLLTWFVKTENWTAVIAYAVGAWLGTYWIVRRNRGKK
jgi:hypothetical protein